MRWLRENWLDFLIFLLIALVAAGIILYLTGVNPFARPAPQVIQPPAPQAPASSSQPSPSPPPAQEAKPSPKGETPVITVLPLPQAPSETKPEAKPAPAQPESPKAPPAPAAPARPAPPASSPQGAYRVAVGAFSDPANALRLSQELAQKGYRVRLEASGGLTRVVVGPYATEAEAERVAQALSAYAPQVYRGQAPAPQQGVYLQVAALERQENAQALAERLRREGFSVVLVRDGLYKVRVGPLEPGAKAEAQARLKALGLEALEVR